MRMPVYGIAHLSAVDNLKKNRLGNITAKHLMSTKNYYCNNYHLLRTLLQATQKEIFDAILVTLTI